MTFEINTGHLVVGVVAACAGPVVSNVIAERRRSRQRREDAIKREEQYKAAAAQQIEHHRQNTERLRTIELAIGIARPGEAVFPLGTEVREWLAGVQEQLREIREQLGNGKPGRFADRGHVDGLERAMIGDHATLRQHGVTLIQHQEQITTLRRDVDGLRAEA